MGTPADPFQLDGFVIDGKYRVATVVGDGGFGVVYRGVHKGFGELIAVKCLKIPGELDDAEREALLEQLREEGRLLHRLSKVTSGIVQALDVGAFTAPSGAWVPYLVLEWLEGEPLSALMRRRERGEGGMTAREALDLLEPAARALAIAHEQKVAHRDVKPANLFVTEVGGRRSLKVLDFGIAKVLSEHHSKTGLFEATGTAPTAFTPRYGAPEQFNKKRGASGPWTDVFALALIFVELVIAKRALEGDDPTQLYVASADATHRPTLRARGAESSDEVERVLARALAVEPRERWPDVGTFWSALEAAVRAAPAGSQPAPDVDDAPAGPGAPTVREAAAFGPTLPAESLPRARSTSSPQVSTPKSSGPPSSAPAVPALPISAQARGDARGDGADDPMAETPAGARASGGTAVTAASPAAKAAPEPAGARAGGFPWGIAAAAIFVAGAGFAWLTWSGATGAPDGAPSASARKGPPIAPRPPPSARARASASASASAVGSAAPAPSGSAPEARFTSTEGMVRLGPATFSMGGGSMGGGSTADGSTGDGVKVELPRAFWIDAQEVTLRQYRTCDEGCGATEEASSAYADWSPKCNAARGALDEPINCVDWASAAAFCAQKGKRLPTEAEWELAARGQAGRPFPWGEAAPTCEATCGDRNGECSAQGLRATGVSTCAPGTHATDRTPEGVWDLAGNVAEWVQDGFAEALPGGTDPRGPSDAKLRVVRGGSFAAPLADARGARRVGVVASAKHAAIGFRCAMDADGGATP